MDNRRRPTIFGLGLLIWAVLGSPALASVLSSQAPAESLRTLVPDAIYAAGVTADFSNLHLRDDKRRALDFAVCPLHEVDTKQLKLPLLAVPDLARPILDSNDALTYERPAGAGPIESLRYWILDLRSIKTPIRELHGAPQIAELRDSPSLRQWSAPIRFTQNEHAVQLAARPLKFVRLEPPKPLPWPQPQPQVRIESQSESAQRKPHWFAPSATEQTTYQNQRKMAVIAARIDQPESTGPVVLQSRQGPWDAWKPRGQWNALQDGQILRFSGVSDPQWRVLGLQAGQLKLAHSAHELHISGLQSGQQLLLEVSPATQRASSVSCLNDERWPTRQNLNWQPLSDNQSASTPRSPANLRGGFIILLGFVLTSIWAFRRYRQRG